VKLPLLAVAHRVEIGIDVGPFPMKGNRGVDLP
jgi:hypothetical protein